MREEWELKINALREEVLAATGDIDNDGKEESLLSAELKVRHVDSGIRYTVDSVGPRDVILRTPEDELITVDRQTLETEYELA